jgi:N6-adenosine-specific RNA methylase IME4
MIREPRREHSRKPDRTRADIMRLVAGPYLEMFSRQSTPEWDTWGDQQGKFDGQPIQRSL